MNLFSQMKKVLASVVTTGVVAMSLVLAPSAGAFSDVPSDAWFAPYVEALTDAGIFKDGDMFRPADNMNRAEFVKTLVESAGLSTDGAADAGFSDVSSSDWFFPYVNAAVEYGIINGSDKSSTFRPADNISRAEAVKIALNAFGIDYEDYQTPAASFTDDNGHWAEPMITAAYNLSIVDGKGGSKTIFAPNEAISRSAVAKIASYTIIVAQDPDSYVRFDGGDSAFSVFEPTEIVDQVTAIVETETPTTPTEPTDPTDPTEPTDTTDETPATDDIVVSDGSLEVSLSPDTPTSVTLPKGAAAVPFMKVDLTANGDDIILTSLAFHRFGVGDPSAISGLFLYDEDGIRLTSSVTVATYDNMARFDNLKIQIDAGDTKTLTLQGDISTTANAGQHAFELQTAEAVGSNAEDVVGDFPIRSNIMDTNSTDANPMVVDQSPVATTSVAVGTDNVQVARFKISAPADQDIQVSRITLTNGGNVDSTSLTNFVLKQNGVTLGEAAGMVSIRGDDIFTVNLTESFAIQKGNSRIFEVYADVISGRSAETIQFYLENAGDIVAKGMTYGFNVGATALTSTYMTQGNVTAITLKAGKLTINFNGPTAADVVSGANDVVLGEYSLTSGGNDLEIKGMEFSLVVAGSTKTAGASVSGLTNVRLVDLVTGDVLLSDNTSFNPNSTATNFNGTWTLNFQEGIFTLRAGKTMKVGVLVNIPATSTAGSLDLSLDKPSTTWGYVKDLVTGKRFSSVADWNEVVPDAQLTANTMTIGAAGMTVTYGSGVGSSTVVRGGENINLAQFALKADRGSDLTVRSIKLTGQILNAAGGQTLKDAATAISLYDGDTQVGSARSFDSSSEATIDGMNFVVPSGTTKSLTAKVSLSKNSVPFAASAPLTTVEVRIAAATDVVVDDANGNSLAGASINVTAVSWANAPDLTVKRAGSISAEKDPSTRSKSILTFGSSKEEVASYRFQNIDEAFKMTDLAFKAYGNRASAELNIAGAVTDGDTITLGTRVYCYKVAAACAGADVVMTTTDGSTAFAGANPTQSEAEQAITYYVNNDASAQVNIDPFASNKAYVWYPGTAGNAIAVAETGANISFTGGVVALSGGTAGSASKVARLYLYANAQPIKTEGGADAVATVSEGGKATFSNLALEIDQATIVTVKADLASLQSSDNTGTLNQFYMEMDALTDRQAIRAYGVSSSERLDATQIMNGSIAGNDMVTRATTITIDFPSVTASSGLGKTIAQMNIANTANEQNAEAELTELKMSVTSGFDGGVVTVAGGGKVSNMKLYKSGNASNSKIIDTVDGVGYVADANIPSGSIVAWNLSSYTDRYIAAGTSASYYIIADILTDTKTDSTQKLQLSVDISGTGTTGLTWKDGRVVSGKYTPSASAFIYMPSKPSVLSSPQLSY